MATRFWDCFLFPPHSGAKNKLVEFSSGQFFNVAIATILTTEDVVSGQTETSKMMYRMVGECARTTNKSSVHSSAGPEVTRHESSAAESLPRHPQNDHNWMGD